MGFFKHLSRAIVVTHILASPGIADDLRIVTWNASPALPEGLETRLDDFEALADALNPDILVLVEIGGGAEAKMIADALGWETYHAVASNWARAETNVFFALEAAIISKVPIEQAIEYDASPDGHHEVFTEAGVIVGKVREEELTTAGIAGFGQPLARTDRGTLRVDLEGGLSLFPLHLKSNRNSVCSGLSDTIRFLDANEFDVPDALTEAREEGFAGTTREHRRNAEKRERVMAATARLAAAADAEGRLPVIAGDLNTAFEPGKYGTKVADCDLQAFACRAAPFPAEACTNGDGFDDTLGMLTSGLIDELSWQVLSEGLGRTYDDTRFADLAIDHVAVPLDAADAFTIATKAESTFGSDHYPIVTVYSPTE